MDSIGKIQVEDGTVNADKYINDILETILEASTLTARDENKTLSRKTETVNLQDWDKTETFHFSNSRDPDETFHFRDLDVFETIKF